MQVLLVFVLGQVILSRVCLAEEGDFGGGGAKAGVGKLACVGIHELLDLLALLLGLWVERRAVLRADIVALAEALGGVVSLQSLDH